MDYPRAEVVAAISRSVPPNERILLTGASGWFGRTALALLVAGMGRRWTQKHVLATASKPRQVPVLGLGVWPVKQWDPPHVSAFGPSTILNCAFPTPGRLEEMGHEPFVATARHVTASLLEAARLPTIVRVVNFSSGASLPSERYPADIHRNPYGFLKAEEDELLEALATERGFRRQTIRVWAVSGPQVPDPYAYAYSDLVDQAARGGPVRVASPAPVYRCFTAVEDLICMGLLLTSLDVPAMGAPVLDSGGEVVELGSLAERIAQVAACSVQPRATVPGSKMDVYLPAAPEAFAEACQRVGFMPASLDRQIEFALMAARIRSG